MLNIMSAWQQWLPCCSYPDQNTAANSFKSHPLGLGSNLLTIYYSLFIVSCVSVHFLKESIEFSSMLQQHVQRAFAGIVSLGTLHAFLPSSSQDSSLNPTFPSCGSLQRNASEEMMPMTRRYSSSLKVRFKLFSSILSATQYQSKLRMPKTNLNHSPLVYFVTFACHHCPSWAWYLQDGDFVNLNPLSRASGSISVKNLLFSSMWKQILSYNSNSFETFDLYLFKMVLMCRTCSLIHSTASYCRVSFFPSNKRQTVCLPLQGTFSSPYSLFSNAGLLNSCLLCQCLPSSTHCFIFLSQGCFMPFTLNIRS